MASGLSKETCQRIKHLRKSRGLRQIEVAKALNLSLSAYSKIENEERNISTENCIALADFYGVTCDYLLRGIESESIDICSRTCLTQQSVNALIDLHEDFKLSSKEYRAFLETRSKDDYENRQFSSIDEIQAYWKEQDIQGEIELNMRNSVYCGQITNHLINTLIQNKDFLDGLSRACFDCVSAILSDIYVTSRYGFNLESKRGDYRKGINAAKYEAGQIFGNFFSGICRDADFVSYLFELSEDDLIFALEKGILSHVDN